MSVQTASPQTIDFFPGSPIHFQHGDGRFSGDGGLLLLRQLDDDLGFTQASRCATVSACSTFSV